LARGQVWPINLTHWSLCENAVIVGGDLRRGSGARGALPMVVRLYGALTNAYHAFTKTNLGDNARSFDLSGERRRGLRLLHRRPLLRAPAPGAARRRLLLHARRETHAALSSSACQPIVGHLE